MTATWDMRHNTCCVKHKTSWSRLSLQCPLCDCSDKHVTVLELCMATQVYHGVIGQSLEPVAVKIYKWPIRDGTARDTDARIIRIHFAMQQRYQDPHILSLKGAWLQDVSHSWQHGTQTCWLISYGVYSLTAGSSGVSWLAQLQVVEQAVDANCMPCLSAPMSVMFAGLCNASA